MFSSKNCWSNLTDYDPKTVAAWRWAIPLFLLCLASAYSATNLATQLADRTAIERVYYQHRLGTKLPFEQALPPAVIEKLVEQDYQKEQVLRQVYNTQITDEQVTQEIRWIERTSRAPEVLVELRHALGNDATRFARTVVHPLIVERELRAHFENDDRAHASERQQTMLARNSILKAKAHNESPANLAQLFRNLQPGITHEVTWWLTSRPASAMRPTLAEVALNSNTTVVTGGLYSAETRIESSPKVNQPSTPQTDAPCYFNDLSPELQQVLRTQMKASGDVSDVVETSNSFLLFLAIDKTPTMLKVLSLTVPKRSLEQWLMKQTKRIEHVTSTP